MMLIDVIHKVFLGCRNQSGYGESGLIACRSALRRFKGILFALILTGLHMVISAHAGLIQNSSTGTANGLSMDLTNASVTLNQSVGVIDLSRSTVTAEPVIVIADGISTSIVTTTLRNSADQPVPGKSITLSSDRGATDIFVQPPATNAGGVAAGTVSSSVAGVSTITSTDTTDGLVLPVKPVVYFTQGRVLELIKTANKKKAVVGDVVTYLVEIKNTIAKDVIEVRVVDRIPPNFKYIKGSARLNGGQLNDPSGNRSLTFNIGVVPALNDGNGNGSADPGEQGYMTLSYQLVIGSGATPGEYENTALARDICDMCVISNYDEAKVTVTLDPLFDLGTIIGKVFEDRDQDGRQDIGEDGIAGAMVALDDGTYVLTDKYGRYHFPAVYPGHRLLKIHIGNLPAGAAATTDEAIVVSVTPGLLAKANFGVIYNYAYKNIGRDIQSGFSVDSEARGKQVHIVGSAKNMTVLINGKTISVPADNVQMVVEDIHDVVEVKDNRLLKPVEFLIRVDGSEEVSGWKVIIFNNDEEVLKTIEGIGPAPGSVQWDGLDNRGKILQGGNVFQYQLEITYKDGTRSRSARRLFGVNRTSLISLSLAGGAFATGSDKLSADATYLLRGVAEALREYPDEKIVIEGHTDSVGDSGMNLKLSKKRAEAAVTYLVDNEGISKDRFTVRWYGESRPVADNSKPGEREFNRRIELKGDISRFDKAELQGQYRTRPVVRINGSSVSVDSYGLFSATVRDEETKDLKVELKGEQGQEIHKNLLIPKSMKDPANIRIPGVEIIEPKIGKVMTYERDSYEDGISPDSQAVNKDGIVMVRKLAGVTESGNTVKLNGKPLAVGPEGMFSGEIRLRMGNNMFKVVAQNNEGGLRIANLMINVSGRDEDGRQATRVKPGPYLTVKLPPEGALLRSTSLAVSGATDYKNRISINGKPVPVQPDGVFAATVELPEGRSHLVIKVTDPEGYTGDIKHEVEVSDTRLFFLAFADAKMGILKGRGYLEGAGMDDQEEYFTDGRVAFYLKGHVLGKYLVTAAFDTGTHEFDKMFKDLDESENDRLLTNLDPDKLYPVYGDSSIIVYDTESQGKLYLAVESDEFNLLVGNYQMNINDTELATYQRTLYGERVEYQSASRTKHGDPDTKITVFGAEVRQAHVRDELSATGGSLYYLSHKDVIEGSEQVTIIIRDKDTGLMLSKLQQRRNVDYQIKYEEGRVMFNRPISSVAEDEKLIDQALLSGSPVFIEVDYETEVESFEKTGYGGRAKKHIGDHVAVGGTYVRDELAEGKYKLQSLDSEVRLGRNTRFLVEYAESSGTDSVIFRSDDGGLTYSEETPAGIQEGKAWKTSAELDIGEWLGSPERIQAGGYYKKLDPGFLSSGNFVERGTKKFGVNLTLRITEPDKLLARYDREEYESGISIAKSRTGSGTIQLVHDKGWWNLAGEYGMRKSEGEVNESTSLGAFRLRMKLTEKLNVSAEHQQTITGPANNQTTLGGEYQIHPSLALSVEGTTGTLGKSAQGGAVFSLGDKQIYLTERISEDDGGRTESTVLGTEAPVGNASKVYSEYQWERSDGDNRQLSLIGAEKKWDMTKGIKLLVAGEHTDIDSDSGDSSRYAFAVGLSYMLDGFNASTRNEFRKEEGDDERVQYVTTNSAELKLSPDYTMLGKYKYSVTRDIDNDSVEAELNESTIGIAYRPVVFDRLNALARYTHLSDQRPLLPGEMEPLITTLDVSSIEWSLDVTKHLEWVEKCALKVKTEETGDRPAVRTHTYLVINRFNFNIWRSFDLGAEYRILVQEEADDKREGWLTELMWEAVEHVRLGLGYNFTDFSDNEFSDNNYSIHGWFIRLQAKY